MPGVAYFDPETSPAQEREPSRSVSSHARRYPIASEGRGGPRDRERNSRGNLSDYRVPCLTRGELYNRRNTRRERWVAYCLRPGSPGFGFAAPIETGSCATATGRWARERAHRGFSRCPRLAAGPVWDEAATEAWGAKHGPFRRGCPLSERSKRQKPGQRGWASGNKNTPFRIRNPP